MLLFLFKTSIDVSALEFVLFIRPRCYVLSYVSGERRKERQILQYASQFHAIFVHKRRGLLSNNRDGFVPKKHPVSYRERRCNAGFVP